MYLKTDWNIMEYLNTVYIRRGVYLVDRNILQHEYEIMLIMSEHENANTPCNRTKNANDLASFARDLHAMPGDFLGQELPVRKVEAVQRALHHVIAVHILGGALSGGSNAPPFF